MQPVQPVRATSFRYASPDMRLWTGAAVARLDRELDRAHITRPLVVTSPSVSGDESILNTVLGACGARGVVTFTGVQADSPLQVIRDAAALARQNACDGVIALGGGSAIVTSRALSMRAAVADRAGVALPLLDVPYVVFPTTPTTAMARLGSAVTLEDGGRLELFDPSAAPAAVLLDTGLLGCTPERVFLDTAAATFANAAEALTTPSLPPLAHADLREAVDLAATALVGWELGGGDRNADRRVLLATAAFLCGRASGGDAPRQATIGLALGHAIQRHGGGNAHGAAMSSALALGLRINAEAATAGQEELLELLLRHVDATDLAEAIVALLGRFGLPCRVEDLGLSLSEIRLMVPHLMQSHFVRTNVRKFAAPDELEAALESEL